MDARSAEPSDVAPLATLWHHAWQDGHAGIVPAALTRARTREQFEERLRDALPDLRVVGPVGAPRGFVLLKGDELYQLFVAAEARGSGVAAALVADAEARLRDAGVEVAWLACAIGNDRAARFYEKCGWTRARTFVSPLELPEGTLELEVWRYEKRLDPRTGPTATSARG